MKKDSPRKYGELYYRHKPTIVKLFSDYLIHKLLLPIKGRTLLEVPQEVVSYDFFYFAVIEGNKVKDVIRVNAQLARLLMKGVEFVELSPENKDLEIGSEYKDGQFH